MHDNCEEKETNTNGDQGRVFSKFITTFGSEFLMKTLQVIESFDECFPVPKSQLRDTVVREKETKNPIGSDYR